MLLIVIACSLTLPAFVWDNMVVCPNSCQAPVKCSISPQRVEENYVKVPTWCPWAAAACRFLVQLEGV